MKEWEVNYGGYVIRVENRLFGERLIVDGVLQDEHTGLATHRTLRGKVGAGNERPIESVLVRLAEGTDEGVACEIYVEGRLVYASSNARATRGSV
jgi:hypothetical protein